MADLSREQRTARACGKRLHELKTWAEPFEAVWEGRKPYEIRKDDRGFVAGDLLWLRKYDPERGVYLGREILAEVTYLTPGGEWGLPPDVAVLGISVLFRRAAEPSHG